MLGLRKRCDYRCVVFFVFYALSLLPSSTWCYDPCPESMRRSAKRSNIPASEVEKAFQEAGVRVEQRRKLEKKLVGQGRIVNRKIKSPESTHQQARAPPVVREMELRQLMFEEASTILAKKYKMTSDDVCCGLPKVELREPSAASAVQECVRGNPPIQCDASARYRTADGTCNNLNNPTWGSAFSCFLRFLSPAYSGNEGFRLSVTGEPLPAPRNISLIVHSNVNKSTNYINHMYMFFGQLLDHDLTLTAPSMTENNEAIECCPPTRESHPQCSPVMVENDPFYSSYNMPCLNFVRSAICPYCTAGPRAQMNELTAFMDASMVYGNSQNETDGLRTNDGTGRLRVQRSNYGDLLPPSSDPQNDDCSEPAQNRICFRAGDRRVNQHAVLSSLQTVCVREHNRIATSLRNINPQWNDETIFQEARKILGAVIQVITYKEYLPTTLGSERMSYFNLWMTKDAPTYDSTMDPTLHTEFSTAAFRFGHTLIHSYVAEKPGAPGHYGHWLRDMFFFPFGIYNGELNHLMRGVTCSPAQYFDRHMVPDVTNYLYRIRGNPTGFDLASFNIQRGRDHGLQAYIYYVRFCSDQKIIIRSFDDLQSCNLMTYETVGALRKVYSDVRDIDLFTGCISEIWNQGAVIGPTATCIVGIQFHRLKFGDRFYFENSNQPGAFTSSQIYELKKTGLSRLLCDHTNITEIQSNAMLYASSKNPIQPCYQIPAMDLTKWRQQ